MTREHYAAIIGVIVGYVVCRIFSYRIVDGLGAIGGHHRAGDAAVGAVFGAVPFVVLTIYSVLLLRGAPVDTVRWLRVVAGVGLLFAGGVMGILPYSRFGTETSLVQKERAGAPGFLHALDVTVAVGVVLVVVLLLVSLRMHQQQDRSRVD